MRYLSSISLALIVHVLLSIGVLMALACTATSADLSLALRVSDHSRSEVLKVLEDWSKASTSNEYVSRSCWAALDMGNKKYTVNQNPDNSHVYWVSGVSPNQTESTLPHGQTESTLPHGVLELTYPATWTVVMHPENSSNHPTPNIPKAADVTPTSFEPSIKELGC